MTMKSRTLILRVNAIFLVAASTGGLFMDVSGIFFGRGPQSGILSAAPHAGIGFIEAHGLALILGVLLWRAVPVRRWHLTAVAIHILLGTANLVFWSVFVVSDMLAVGYGTTALHWTFVVLQALAAAAERSGQPDAPRVATRS